MRQKDGGARQIWRIKIVEWWRRNNSMYLNSSFNMNGVPRP